MKTTHYDNVIKVDDYALDNSKQSLFLDIHNNLQAVLFSPSTPELLKHNLRGWTTWQQRTGITLEQVILSPNLAPQWIAALLAWGAHLGPITNNGRSISLADHLQGIGSDRSRPTQLLIPIHPPSRRWGEASVGRTPSDQPVVSAIAVVDMEKDTIRSTRLALTGVWRETVRLAQAPDLLRGKPLTEESILQIVEAIQNEVEPKNTWHGGAEYRRSMAALMTRRALEQCIVGEKGQ